VRQAWSGIFCGRPHWSGRTHPARASTGRRRGAQSSDRYRSRKRPWAGNEPEAGSGVWAPSSFRRSSSGSLAMFAAIRHASSVVSSLAAARRPGLVLEIEMPQLFPGRLADDEAGVGLPRRPRRREAALRHSRYNRASQKSDRKPHAAALGLGGDRQ
jgi:hypothetical protein